MNDPGGLNDRNSTSKRKKDEEPLSAEPAGAKKHASLVTATGKSTTSPDKLTSKKVDLYVVVADDDVDDHKLITKAVKDCGGNHLVTSVYNGQQLMNLLLRNGFYKVDSDRFPDIIILDLKMPVMDGYDVLREIKGREALKHIPVFVLSDAQADEERKKVAAHGGDKFFSKPFSYEELKKLMSDICSEAIRLAAARQVKP